MKENIFDYIIITVSNEQQKNYLEESIKKRKNKKTIPLETNYIIIVEKEKIGSGGAIFNLIRFFETRNKNVFNEKKILLINSAGDSKRIILYADNGKICVPTFEESQNNINSIIFDEIIVETEKIGRIISPGLLIVSGDCTTIYKDFKTKEIKNNTAFSIKEDVKVGLNHGVFVEKDGILYQALQKNTEQELRNKNAVDKNNKINLDTGMIYINAKTIEKLRNIITANGIYNEEKFKKIANVNVKLNFYTDIVYPLSNNSNLEEYLELKGEVPINNELINARKQIWKNLSKSSLEILTLNNGRFIHYGTVKEFIQRAFELTKKEYILVNSEISLNSKISEKCYIENSIIENSIIGENTIILNSEIINKNIPSNLILKTIKLQDKKYVTIILGINDNLKENDYNKIKLFNMNIGNRLKENNFINQNNKSLWECELYSIQNTRIEAIESALELYNYFKQNNYQIEKQNRKSIKEILKNQI